MRSGTIPGTQPDTEPGDTPLTLKKLKESGCRAAERHFFPVVLGYFEMLLLVYARAPVYDNEGYLLILLIMNDLQRCVF